MRARIQLSVANGGIMSTLSPSRTGMIVGAFTGFWHLLWSVVVGIGVAASFLDWVYGIHFLSNPFHVAQFNIFTALLLVCISFAMGYVIGWFFALLWNALAKRKPSAELLSRAA